jgi:hypothetical protein
MVHASSKSSFNIIDTPSKAFFKQSQLSDPPAIMKLAQGIISNFNSRI